MVLRIFKKDKIYLPCQKLGDYTVLKRIGEGRYGICYLIDDGQQKYILKQLKKGMLKKSGAKTCFEEEILMQFRHESIPRFIKRMELESFYGYILEYKEGRTFEEVIYSQKHCFDRAEIYRVGIQIINILKYLHNRGVVHRDIRVPNTLYDGNTVYLVDFGLARWVNNKKYKTNIDFAYLGDFLLHLYYTSFEKKDEKKRPWYEELDLGQKELFFFKKLMGLEARYNTIADIERDFSIILGNNKTG